MSAARADAAAGHEKTEVTMRHISVLATVLFAGAGLVTGGAALQAAEQDTARTMVESLAQFRFDQLGHPQIQTDSIKPVLASKARPHRLLILPVRFSDTGYDRFAGDADQDEKNRAYFQDLLFGGCRKGRGTAG